ADVVVIEAARLVHGQLDDLLGAGCEADVAQDDTVAAPNDKLDSAADLVQLDAKVTQHLRGYSIALADEAQKQMLGANIIMVEALGFFLCEAQYFASPLRKLIESVAIVHF